MHVQKLQQKQFTTKAFTEIETHKMFQDLLN